jgi:tripartite ATP-independent transporter DctP family solute receptor
MVMFMNRRRFAVSVAATVPGFLLINSNARAAEFNWKASTSVAIDHPLNVRLIEAAKRMREQSSGRIDLQIFPSAQLGGDVDVLSQTLSGAVSFQMISPITVAGRAPQGSLHGVGFAFKDYSQVWAAMDGDVGAFERRALEQAGFHVFEKYFDNGFRQLTTSTKQVKNASDLKNLKIRVPSAPLWVSLFKSMGAAATALDLSEVYSALQTKIVDGQENALQLVESNKLNEVQKYCALTNHMWDGWAILCGKNLWNKVPDNLKDIVTKSLNQAVLDERKDIAESTASTQARLTKLGLTFNEPDRESFRKVLAASTYYADWHQKFGNEGWAALEKYCGKLG